MNKISRTNKSIVAETELLTGRGTNGGKRDFLMGLLVRVGVMKMLSKYLIVVHSLRKQ